VGIVILQVVVVVTVATTWLVDQELSDAGGEDGDGTLVLAAVGALTGAGSLALGIADYVRNSLRYSRERRRTDADWRRPGGYL
jgi:hypothetical protein